MRILPDDAPLLSREDDRPDVTGDVQRPVGERDIALAPERDADIMDLIDRCIQIVVDLDKIRADLKADILDARPRPCPNATDSGRVWTTEKNRQHNAHHLHTAQRHPTWSLRPYFINIILMTWLPPDGVVIRVRYTPVATMRPAIFLPSQASQ